MLEFFAACQPDSPSNPGTPASPGATGNTAKPDLSALSSCKCVLLLRVTKLCINIGHNLHNAFVLQLKKVFDVLYFEAGLKLTCEYN